MLICTFIVCIWHKQIFSWCGSNYVCFLISNQSRSKRDEQSEITKPTKWLCAQRRLGSAGASTQSVQTESSLRTQWAAEDPRILHADREDSDQTGRMPRLIWVFDGRTCHFVGFIVRLLTFFSILRRKLNYKICMRIGERYHLNSHKNCYIL